MGIQDGTIIRTPCRIVMSAPSCGGKTYTVVKLLTGNILYPFPTHIYYCYSYWQPALYGKLKNFFGTKITFIKGFTAELLNENYLSADKPACIVLDDQMSALGPDIVRLMSETSHHKNCSVILLLQTLFPCNKYGKTITSQATHMFLYDNPRDKNTVKCFARQAYPNNVKQFMEVYDDATSVPYGYLCVDLLPTTPRDLRLRTNITEPYKNTVVYIFDGLYNEQFTLSSTGIFQNAV